MVPLIGLAWAGSAELSVTELEVQTKATLDLTWAVGPEGLGEGQGLRAMDPVFHGMRWAKWGYLSQNPADCSELSEPNTGASGALVTVSTSGNATVAMSRSTNARGLHDRAWTEVLVTEGALVEGDTLTFHIGAGGGICGLQTSDRTMVEVPWPIHSNVGGEWVHVASPRFDFVTTRPVERLLLTVPSQGSPGEDLRVLVAALDRLGNPVPGYTGLVQLGDQSHRFEPSDQGVWETTVSFDQEGIHRLTVLGTGLAGESNPVRIAEEPGLYGIYWGDLHTHHGHSWTDPEGFTHDLNHEYARDVVGLQVGCESVKAYPHELDWDTLWPEQQQTCETHTDADYVAMLCYEWMGNENSPGQEGHHNVYYDTCDGPLAPNSTTGLTGGDDSLWVFMLEAEAATGARSVSAPHAPVYTGYNWRDRDDVLRPVAEIYSEWGDSSAMNGPASSVYDGLALGNRMGLIASSDNHDGWLGNRWSVKETWGGLAAFVATDLSREGVFESLEQRSTYATTGHRPLLGFEVQEGEALGRMGWEVVAEEPLFHWTYSAEGAAISRVELLTVRVDGGGPVERLALWTPEGRDAEGSFAPDWDGQDRAVWLFVVEGENMAWSSPIWLTRKCGVGQDIAGLCEEGDTALESGAWELPVVQVEPECGCATPTRPARSGWAFPLLAALLGLRRDGGSGPAAPPAR